jgi:hypothetical protein
MSGSGGPLRALLGPLFDHILKELEDGGPDVVLPAIVAYVDDEMSGESPEPALSPERSGKVQRLIWKYKNWFRAYWQQRVSAHVSLLIKDRGYEDLETLALVRALGEWLLQNTE